MCSGLITTAVTFVRPTFVRPTFNQLSDHDICPTLRYIDIDLRLKMRNLSGLSINWILVRPTFVRPDIWPTYTKTGYLSNLYICRTWHLSDPTFIQKSLKYDCLSVCPSIHPSIRLSVCPSVCPFSLLFFSFLPFKNQDWMHSLEVRQFWFFKKKEKP